jgi:hypothetical protein
LYIYDMANPSLELIQALRTTANNLQEGSTYAWGHHGACNCGNLLQTVTHLTKEEVLRAAHAGNGEWTELAQDWCEASKAPHDLLLSKLAEIGLQPSDIHDLEYLANKEVLHKLPGGFRWLSRNVREDVVVYFNTFAQMLEERLIQLQDIREVVKHAKELGEQSTAPEMVLSKA